MSSTDLADERTKHDIELAEKEALEHSILQKITAPRAKITHKGFETIEDITGQRASDAKEEEERMEMEKRERERQARQRKASVIKEGSPFTPVEPSPLSATFPGVNSPVTANNTAGDQASNVAAASSTEVPPTTTGRPLVRAPFRPLFVPTLPEAPRDTAAPDEGGLSLSDLIDLDSAGSKEASTFVVKQEPIDSSANRTDSPEVTSPSGPSPFAPPQSAQASSFDLGSFWTAREKEVDSASPPQEGIAEAEGEEKADNGSEEAMDIDESESHDDALDAILAQDKVKSPVETLLKQPNLSALPVVWTGHVSVIT